ncbi:hypothetical protein L4D09_19455 [Photobacterium makurazakiensis]|uniref:hypothetical protein n=1 Tax=Photobacterium makurazakiensis TaxID=2910234 RepID=UPI003D0E3D90
MKLALLTTGVLLQFIALFVAFYSDVEGNIYIATLISVAAMGCIVTIRSLAAPVCLIAGILIGLSLSHNQSDLKTLNLLEQQAIAALNFEEESIENSESGNVIQVEPILTVSTTNVE